MSQIHVLVATNNNGCMLLSTLMASLGLTTKSPITLHVLHDDLTGDNQQKLTQVAQDVKLDIEFIKVTENFDFYVPKQWPLPTLFRLLADTLFPKLDKIIYLDIDTLVYQDIASLWDINLDDNYLGACYGLDVHRDLGHLDPDKKVQAYFNAGVLLMNLQKMRADHVGEKCLKFLKEHTNELRAFDQDVLNIVCAGKILPISIGYNWYISMERRNKRKLTKIYGTLPKQPSIIHFYSAYKPYRLCIYLRHPIATYRIWRYERAFWKYLKLTPYAVKREIQVKL